MNAMEMEMNRGEQRSESERVCKWVAKRDGVIRAKREETKKKKTSEKNGGSQSQSSWLFSRNHIQTTLHNSSLHDGFVVRPIIHILLDRTHTHTDRLTVICLPAAVCCQSG